MTACVLCGKDAPGPRCHACHPPVLTIGPQGTEINDNALAAHIEALARRNAAATELQMIQAIQRIERERIIRVLDAAPIDALVVFYHEGNHKGELREASVRRLLEPR